MRYLQTVVLLFLLSVLGLAQTSALPASREKLGGTDPNVRIAREVLHELLMDPYYSVFDNLAFKVDKGTVTLMGQVAQPVVKSDAVASVKHIEGVENVVDNIEVLPVSPNDDRLRRQLYGAVYGYDSLSRYGWGAVPSIHIIVKNGHVDLVGAVDNEGDKNLAGIRANGVPGVFSVKNDLQVISRDKGKTAESKDKSEGKDQDQASKEQPKQ